MAKRTPHSIHVGISGWTYVPWRGTFYPKDVTQKRELEYASRQLNSIEINGSFYSLQKPSSYQQWYEQTPADFVFAVKGGRFITHMKKLKDVRVPLANFFASGLLCLKEKLGPILWQFPATFALDLNRFSEFFDLLPHNTRAAAALSAEHAPSRSGKVWTETDKNRPIRYSVEIRHPSFLTPDFMTLLRKHNIAFVFADSAGRYPFAEDLTADFVYCRLHGAEELYVSGYTTAGLDYWAERLRKWTAGDAAADARLTTPAAKGKAKPRDAYVYFDNDAKVRSPYDAIQLSRRLGLPPPQDETLSTRDTNFLGEPARASWPKI